MMARNVAYTRTSGNYTGAVGVINARTRIATWEVQAPRGVVIGEQRPGAKTLVVFVQSTVPAHIPTGTMEIVVEDSLRESGHTEGAMRKDNAEVPTTLAIATNQDTAITYGAAVKASRGDFISIYFTSGVVSVDANCTYSIPVREL